MIVLVIIAFIAAGYIAIMLGADSFGVAFVAGLLGELILICMDVRYDVKDIKKLLAEKKDGVRDENCKKIE